LLGIRRSTSSLTDPSAQPSTPQIQNGWRWVFAEAAYGQEVDFQLPLPWFSCCAICYRMVRALANTLGLHAHPIPRLKQAQDPRLAGLNTLKFSVWISRGAGLALSVDGAMILLPMCRTMLRYIRPKVKFLPLDESQFFHRQVAYSLLFWTLFHVCAHYVK
jgi:hypothetical protein